MVLPFKDSSEAAEPRCATFSAIKLPNTLAGLRRGLASLWRRDRNLVFLFGRQGLPDWVIVVQNSGAGGNPMSRGLACTAACLRTQPVGARSRATGVARVTKMNTAPSVITEVGLQNPKGRF